MLRRLLIPTATIISVCLSFCFVVFALNLLRFTLIISQINHSILDLFDNSSSPWIYLKFAVLTLILLFIGDWIGKYLDRDMRKIKKKHIRY